MFTVKRRLKRRMKQSEKEAAHPSRQVTDKATTNSDEKQLTSNVIIYPISSNMMYPFANSK
jgi:hypothetical protein